MPSKRTINQAKLKPLKYVHEKVNWWNTRLETQIKVRKRATLPGRQGLRYWVAKDVNACESFRNNEKIGLPFYHNSFLKTRSIIYNAILYTGCAKKT